MSFLSSEYGWLGATVSDSQNFLTWPLENFISKGEQYIRNNDNLGARHVVDKLIDLVLSAQNIQFVGSRIQTENDIFTQCRGYLDQLIDFAIRYNNMEILYQCAVGYKRIGQIIIDRRFESEFYGLFTSLDKIAYHALKNNLEIVWGQVVDDYTVFAEKLLLSRNSILQIEFKILLEHLRGIILYGFFTVNSSTIEGSLAIQTGLAKPFRGVIQALVSLIKQVESIQEEKEYAYLQGDFITAIDELYIPLRYLADNMKNADHLLVETLARVITDIGCLSLQLSKNDKWNKYHRELLKQVNNYLHLPEWFIHYAVKIDSNNYFDSLVEAVAMIGLKGIEVAEYDFGKEAVAILSNFADTMFDKEKRDKFGFTEPRIMERACYIGILALKKDQKEIVKDLKNEIQTFEKKYKQRYFANLPDNGKVLGLDREQLQEEIRQLRDELEESKVDEVYEHVFDSSKYRLMEKIEVADIDNFTTVVWDSIRYSETTFTL